MSTYYVYILSNKRKTTYYIGITNSLERRVIEHKSKIIESFTKRYNLTDLLYYEAYSQVKDALAREKQLKNWHRDWKLNLIKKFNPKLLDLFTRDAETSSA